MKQIWITNKIPKWNLIKLSSLPTDFARAYFKIYSGFSTPYQRDTCLFFFFHSHTKGRQNDHPFPLALLPGSAHWPMHHADWHTSGGMPGLVIEKGSMMGKVRTGRCKLQGVSLIGYIEKMSCTLGICESEIIKPQMKSCIFLQVRVDSWFWADSVVWRNWVVFLFPRTTWMSVCCWCRVTGHTASWGSLILVNERFTNSNNQSLKAKQLSCKRNICKQTIFVSQILLSLLQNTVILGNKSYSFLSIANSELSI